MKEWQQWRKIVHMKFRLLFYFALMCMISCSRNSICGLYSGSNLQLSINADSTYNLEITQGCFNPRYSNGKWEIEGDSLVLNSSYDILNLPLSVSESKNNDNGKYTFNIIDVTSLLGDSSLDYCKLVVNDSLAYDLERNSPRIITLLIKPIYFYIKFQYYANAINCNYLFKTKKYFVSSDESNQFNVNLYLKPRLVGYQTIDNLKLYHKKNIIFWYDDQIIAGGRWLKKEKKGSNPDYPFEKL